MLRLNKFSILFVLGAVAFAGCNLTGGIDEPGDRDSVIEYAKAKIDSGETSECVEAYQKLEALGGEINSDVRQLMGWAKLCTARVTMGKVASTLFNFSSSATRPYYIVGDLANLIVPQDTTTIANIDAAITQFGMMDTSDEQRLSKAMANLIRAAAYVAKASSDSAKTVKNDVSPAACSGVTCSTGSAACTAQNMSNGDADAVATSIQNASALVQASGFGNVGTLVQNLNSLFNGAGSALSRCYIVNEMLRQ